MRSKVLRASALVAALGLVAAACGGSSGSDPPSAAASSDSSGEAVAFTAAHLGGGEFASSSLVGRDAVLWFWAPWCTVCRGEAGDVVAAADAFAGKVEVIGVAGRGEVSEMEGFVSDTGTGALKHVVDSDGQIWSAFGVFAQPAYAFVDDGGEVEVFVGAMGEDALTERMQALAEA